jgi:SulP family sulfate permease
VVVLPQGVAFATIAGMPPEYGLYAGMVPAIVAALFGSSWHLVSGPTTAASVVLYSSLSEFASPGSAAFVQLALTLTFMVGITQLALGLARLGALVNFISHSVLVGFTAGAAILIASKQLKHFFGVSMDSSGHAHDIVLGFVSHLGDVNPYVATVSLGTLMVGIVVKMWRPKAPYLVIAMVAGALIAALLNQFVGAPTARIETVGALAASLPPLSAPDFSFETIRKLAPASLAVTLFALTEAVSIGRSLALKSGQSINGNQEFVGQGLSNIAGSFFSGYVATGSFNRSAMNFQAGARTPIAAVFAGTFLMVVVLLVAPLAVYLPNGAMAGILFLVAWRLIDIQQITHIIATSRAETAVMATTFLGAVFLELDFAIFAGVLLSLILYLNRTSRPRILARVPNPDDPKRKFTTNASLPECPQVKFVRIDGSLFFGAVSHVETTLQRYADREPGQKHLVVLAHGINFVDLTGAEYLSNEAQKRADNGGDVYFYAPKPGVIDFLRRSGFRGYLDEAHVEVSKTRLVQGVVQRLDRDICASCHKRIFRECKNQPGEPVDQQ